MWVGRRMLYLQAPSRTPFVPNIKRVFLTQDVLAPLESRSYKNQAEKTEIHTMKERTKPHQSGLEPTHVSRVQQLQRIAMMLSHLVSFPISLIQRKLLHFASPTIRTTHEFMSAPLTFITL